MFHVIATRTVLPTLRSARDHCAKPRTPQIMHSGDDPQALWHKVVQQIGATLDHTNDVMQCLRGFPIYVTAEWSYWLVDDQENAARHATIVKCS